MQKTEYVNGIYVKKGKYGTKVSFKLDAFIEEIKSKKNKDGFVNIEIKEAKSGEKLYAVYDTWEPKGGQAGGQVGGQAKATKPQYQSKSNDDLPF
jgi:low affinity Fe/Cu permease